MILSFLGSKVENESFPCVHNLGERTGQVQYITTRQSSHVRTHEKNLADAVRRLGKLIESIFCAQSGASILLTVWKCSGKSRYPGAFPLVFETFVAPFLPTRLTAPGGSPRIGFTDIRYIAGAVRKGEYQGG